MLTFFVIVLFAVVFYFGYKFYAFDNSTFARETGYNFFQTLTNKKIATLKTMYDFAQRSNASFLINVQINDARHKYIADAVLIHSSAIYVVQFVDKKGWITGTEKGFEWIEQMHGGKAVNFPNPIHDNLRTIYAIRDVVENVDSTLFESVVVFSDDCSFQKIELTSNTVEVVKMKDVPRLLEKITGQNLSENERNQIYSALKKYCV